MSREGSHNYQLVDNKISLIQSLCELKSLKANARLAVDCEGVDLSRKGELTIVTVATKEKAYIFDITVLKEAAFDEGLREILQDKSREKLMFDCRQDSDSLWHQYRVKLSGVLDIQLLEVMYRHRTYGNFSSLARHSRRSDRFNEVEKIRGFKHCLELYINDCSAIDTKDAGRMLVQQDNKVWKRRPLSDTLLRYCAVDTLELFKLYNELKSSKRSDELSRLRIASERYANLFRSKSARSFDEYESNGFLPLDVVPDVEPAGSLLDNKKCNGCKRLFPREEFSEMQLRSGNQKCRVCRKIKQRGDARASRNEWCFGDYLEARENDAKRAEASFEAWFDNYQEKPLDFGVPNFSAPIYPLDEKKKEITENNQHETTQGVLRRLPQRSESTFLQSEIRKRNANVYQQKEDSENSFVLSPRQVLSAVLLTIVFVAFAIMLFAR